MNVAATTPLRENLILLVRPGEASDSGVAFSALGWWVIGLALAAAGIMLWLTRRRRVATEAAPAREAAHIRALRELAVWETCEDETRYRDAVAEISSTVRSYVSERFALSAPYLTTEEFWDVLSRARQIPSCHDPLLRGFMTECDEVKYAGFFPARPGFRRVLQTAQTFISQSAESSQSSSVS